MAYILPTDKSELHKLIHRLMQDNTILKEANANIVEEVKELKIENRVLLNTVRSTKMEFII